MGSGRQARLYMAVASFGCHADCAASTGFTARPSVASAILQLNFVSTTGPITGMFLRMTLTAIMSITVAGSEQTRGAPALMPAHGGSKEIQDAPAYF